MNGDLLMLATEAAGAAWLTKTVVDLIRMKWTSLQDGRVLVLAGVLALLFSFGLAVYRRETFNEASDYVRTVFQGVFAFLGAWGTTEAQTAAKRAVAEAEI